MTTLKLTSDMQFDTYAFDTSPFYAISGSAYHDQNAAIVDAGIDFVFVGSGFTSFDSHGFATSGTVTQFRLVLGSTHADFSDFSADASRMEKIFKTGNTVGLNNVLLGGDDTITTGTGGGIVGGWGGNDTIKGLTGDDGLYGGNGSDTLKGGAGVDTLQGDKDADTLTGGDGNDLFVFSEVVDSKKGAVDTITDLSDTDKIDLHDIDADTGDITDDAFHLAASFSGTAGELIVVFDSVHHRTAIRGDVDGDGKANFVVYAAGDHSDFVNFVF